MTVISIDLETRSEVDLQRHGLRAYATHPSTRVLVFGYAIDDCAPQAWLPHEGKPPAELVEAVKDPRVAKYAWNARFEDALLSNVMNLRLDWHDTMVQALYASLPDSLAAAGHAIGLPEETLKAASAGKRLIRLFSIPRAGGGFNDWHTHPAEFAEFVEYCKQDVVAERAIKNALHGFRLPDSERALWALDGRINARGMPVDMDFVNRALALCAEEKARLKAQLVRDTGLTNVTTRSAFLSWARDCGYPFNDLRRETVARAIREGLVSPTLARILRQRGELSKTSTSKFETIAQLTHEGRLYDAFQFYGASRTGRWSGRGAQPHNLPRPIPEVEGNEEAVTDMVKASDFDGLLLEFGGVLPPVSSVVRSAFRAPPGKVLFSADLNAIENRGIGWLADCQSILDVFRNRRDPYKDFATRMFGVPYEAVTKPQRTASKPAVLGAGYGLSGGEEAVNKAGDLVKTGLWGYAASMGIDMTREQAHESVRVFRAAYPEVVQLWYALKDAAFAAVRGEGDQHAGRTVFSLRPGVLVLTLPSGRQLHYLRPRLENKRRVFKTVLPDGTVREEERWSLTLTYEGADPITKKWGRVGTHGGKLLENLCQAVSRDVLAAGLLAAERKGFDIVLHVHDQIVVEVSRSSHLTVQDLVDCMTEPLPWAAGFPLSAEGEATEIFKK